MVDGPKRPKERIAIGIAQDAEAYRLAAAKVDPGQCLFGINIQMMISTLQLLSHTDELAFKAYAVSHGVGYGSKIGEKKHPGLRHCLLPLLETAIKHNFWPPNDAFGDLIEQLDPYHRTHFFRYRQIARFALPVPHTISEVLKPGIWSILAEVEARWRATQKA
jgi:hypothetical protein